MKIMKKILLLVLSLMFFAGGFAFADTKVFKGKDFTISLQGGKIVFELARDGAKASIPGFFNGWKPEATEAQMVKKNGKFFLEIDIEKFAAKKPYQFKFFVDGNWDPDPNQSLNLKKKGGEWVFAVSPTAKVKSNTKANASIMFKGRFTSMLPIQMDVKNSDWNASGDDGFYFTDTMVNFDLDTHYKIGDSVLGFVRLKINFAESGDRRMNFDAMSGKFFTDDVLLKTFFKVRDDDIYFDNPTQLLRKFIATDYNGISFMGEKNSELYNFGRQYTGLSLKVDSFLNLQIVGTRRVSGFTVEENDFLALRIKPINNKSIVLGVFGLYSVNGVAWDTKWMAQQNGAKYVNPYRINILTGYYNYVGGADFNINFGSLKYFVEAKVVSIDGDAGDNASTGDSLMNIVATTGIQYKTSSFIGELFGSYYSMDDVESMSIITGKVLFKFNGSFKGTVAAAVTVMLPETSDTVLEQRVEVRLKSNLFDPWLYESFRMLENGIGDVYNLIDIKAGLDWYFNAKLVAIFGVRFMNDDNSANSVSYTYSAITPIVGVKYSFTKDIYFSVYYGRDLDYTAYLEDNGMTVEAAAPWNASGTDYSAEKKVAGLHRLTLKMDMKF